MSLKSLMLGCFYASLLFQISFSYATSFTKQEFEQVRQQFRQSFAENPKSAITLINSYLSNGNLTTEQQLVCLNYKSWFLIEIDELSEATRTLVQYQSLADKYGEPVFKYGYNNMFGGLFTRIESYDLALQYHIKAQTIAKELEPRLAYQTDHNIAMLYTNVGRYNEAIAIFERYQSYLQQFDRPLDLNLVLVNLADTQIDVGQLKAARETINRAMEIQRQHNFERYLASSHLILGKIAREEGKFIESITFLNQAIDKFTALSINEEATQAQISLAKTYQLNNSSEKVDALIISALQNAKEHHLPTLEAQIHLFSAGVYEQRKDLSKALYHFKAYQQRHDDILQQQADINLAKAIAESNVASKELKILALKRSKELKAEQAKSFKYVALVIISALILFGTSAVVAIRRINQSNLQLRRSLNDLASAQNKLIETEKVASLTSLASGMAHQLNTPIGTMITAGTLFQEKLEELEHQLNNKTLSQSSLKRFIATAKETKLLILNGTKRLATMVEQFKALNVSIGATQKISQFSLNKVVIETTNRFNSYLDKDVKFMIQTNHVEITSNYHVLADVLVHLITNSFEHGFKQRKTGVITINSEHHNDSITITYEDDGVGIQPEILNDIFTPFFSTNLGGNHLGLGLNVVFNAVKHQLKGDITALPHENGACFILTLPKTLEAPT